MRAPARHPAVNAEIRAAALSYEERCPGLGARFVEEVQSVVRAIGNAPLRYAVRFADVRRANLTRFPFAVWFVEAEGAVYVLGVLHHKRDYRPVLERRHPME